MEGSATPERWQCAPATSVAAPAWLHGLMPWLPRGHAKLLDDIICVAVALLTLLQKVTLAHILAVVHLHTWSGA